MIRGRGGRAMNRAQMRGPYKTIKTHVAKPPFDLTACEVHFPRVQPLNDEAFQSVSDISVCKYSSRQRDLFILLVDFQALEKKILDLTPTEMEVNNLNTMVVEIQKVFDSLIATPSNFSGCVSTITSISYSWRWPVFRCVNVNCFVRSKSKNQGKLVRLRKAPYYEATKPQMWL